MKLKTIAEKILFFKWPVIVLVVALTVFFGFRLNHLKINADILQSLPSDDPDAVLMKQISKEFNGNSMGMVILVTDNVYQTKVLEHVRQITDSLCYTSRN